MTGTLKRDQHRGTVERPWPTSFHARRIILQKKGERSGAELDVNVRRMNTGKWTADFVSRIEDGVEIGSRLGTSHGDAWIRTVQPWVERVVRQLRSAHAVPHAALPAATPHPPWFASAISSQDEPGVRRTFDLLYDEVDARLEAREYDALAVTLNLLAENCGRLDQVIVVAGLRLTWIARISIANWSAVRDRVAQVFQQQGHDVESLLAGLHDR